MASTTFQDFNQNNPIVSAWLNDINNGVYSVKGIAKVAGLIPVAWARFSATGGVITIQQSVGVATVVRNFTGNYTITYNAAITNVTNAYSLSMNQAGFIFTSGETNQTVVVSTQNASQVLVDPTAVAVIVYGLN